MSAQATSWVIAHSPTRGEERLCLLALADGSPGTGDRYFFATARVHSLATFIGCSHDEVEPLVRSLHEAGHVLPHVELPDVYYINTEADGRLDR